MPESQAFESTPLGKTSGTPRPHRRWLRRTLYALASLLAAAFLIAIFTILWLRSSALSSLPQLDGELHLPGLSAPVVVTRDAHGVPTIRAANQDDLFFAQGYVTAQDRLWQMDVYRRNANGDLAEILGPTLVKHDTAQRVLRIARTAQQIYSTATPADRAPWDAYARGVNLFIQQHSDSLPPEFRALYYRPKPWTGADSISIGLMMAGMLDTHWYTKLARERIAAKLHDARLEAQLYPVGSWRDRPPTGEVVDLTKPQPAPHPASDEDDDDNTQTRLEFRNLKKSAPPSSADDLRDLQSISGLLPCDSCAAGSNNWVISGKHTASGLPLLSNDMHLPINVPNIWYMAGLQAPGFHSAGVTLPGMPMVVAGHNEHVAWGFTALYADVQDVYVEKTDGKGNYQAPDGSWKPLSIDREVIHVRASQDVVVDVQSTAHGPLLNPILPKETRSLSLKWTLYDPAIGAPPIYELNTVASAPEFETRLSGWNWPTQNVVFADDQGHIGYHAVGRVPNRPGGLAGTPIQDTQHEWQGYIPFDSMPNAFDPPSGFLATANARVTSDKFPAAITLEWVEPYRVQRIYKSLQGRDQLTLKDMIAVQTDIYSEADQELAHRFAYAIDHAPNTDDRLRKAADLLRSWDGRLTTDSAAASLITQARRQLWTIVLPPKIGDLADEYQWGEKNFAEEEIIMHGTSDWIPAGYKSWDAVLADAVRRGMDKGNAPSDVSRWAYGSWHVMDLKHPLAGLLPFISRIARTGPNPLSGDTTTVKQVGRDFGPSQRFTMDWSSIDGSTENIVLGESGNPYSPYFRDQWKDWYGDTTFAMPFTPSAAAANARHTLRLLP